MNWLIITLIAVFLWAITNVIDKTIVSKYFKKPIIYIFFMGLFSAIPLLAIPYTGLHIVSLWQTVFALLAGVLYLYATIPYIFALFDEEVSRVIPIWQIGPLFVLILSFLFIGETLTNLHLIAFVLILIGSLLISLKKARGIFRLNKAFYLMLLSSLLFAFQYVITRYVYINQSYTNGFLWIRIGTLVGLVPLFMIGHYRKTFFGMVRSLKKRTQLVIAGNEVIGLAGVILLNYAISLKEVSLVNVLEGIQPLFVLILAVILSKWFPRLLKEEIDRKTLGVKVFSIALILVGVYLISI